MGRGENRGKTARKEVQSCVLYLRKPLSQLKIVSRIVIKTGIYSLYIHGGRDLGAGQLDNMWRVDLDSLLRATEDSNFPAHWD